MSGAVALERRIAILQSNYIPWKGYFDIIARADEFFIYDEVQYTRGDWRNRNRIKTQAGVKWLTIPVEFSVESPKPIREVRIADERWTHKHWLTLANAYARAPHFRAYADQVETLYQQAAELWSLSAVNRLFLDGLCRLLDINASIRDSAAYELGAGRTDRLVALCRAVEATHYLSGPAARGYLDQNQFERAGIEIEFMDYSGYQEYPQLFPPFEHRVSVLDLLFNTGPEAGRYLRQSP